MNKLTDKQRKEIVAEYIEGGTSHRKLAQKYHVSTYLVRSILNEDKELNRKISQKKEENTVSVLAFMDSRKESVCDLIDKLLAVMADEDKLAAATLNQLATAMGIVIDKFTANETPRTIDLKETNFFDAVRSAGKGADLSAIPELQSQTASSTPMVDKTRVPE